MNKLAYATHGEAHIGLKDIIRSRKSRGGGRLNTFKCPICGLWHVGHSGRRGRPR
jgi:predicted RNA-binding Zn-ribbon protein involved in translation (DUF1610 family)